MGSKARQSFETRIDSFIEDIELVDVIRKSILEGALTESSPYVLSKVNPTNHRHLHRRTNNPGSREIVINHLRSTVYGYVIYQIVWDRQTELIGHLFQKLFCAPFTRDSLE